MGSGNILGNANSVKSAIAAKQAAKVLERAEKAILGSANRSIRINDYITLYNGNTSGKGRPRPKIRVRGLPVKVVSPALGTLVRQGVNGMTAAYKVQDTMRQAKAAALAGESHWGPRMKFFNGRLGGGVLTFGPSALLDAYQSIDYDTNGKLNFRGKDFLVASAKSQSGNIAGATVGWLTAGGLALVGFVGAPVIVTVLFAGVATQMLWGAFGGADWAEGNARRALE